LRQSGPVTKDDNRENDELRPTALTKAIQQSGHFGMIASSRVDATEKPMLVDERVIGNLQERRINT
jgi:hypothetical protein